MEQLRTVLTQLGKQRLLLMGGVAAAMLALLATVALRGGEDTSMGFLFTDLDPAAAQTITDKLKSQNVPFQLSADGTSVMAPQSRLAELRMGLAGEKLGGKIGYDVLDEEEPFGVSASRARMNETRAIEGELARSISTLQSVSSARVHIVMPERALFATETTKATAAVTVKTKGRLPAEAVEAIRSLVSSSVPSLTPDAVSVVDQTGALLARAGDPASLSGGGADERQAQVEDRLRDQVEALLSPIVGQGKVRAEVAADIDRDQTQEESDVFDPDKQVIAHQVTVGSKDQSSESEAAATGASVATQLPEAQADPAAPGPTSTKAHDETSEDVTYENSKTHSTVLRGPGKIKRLTVAVMIDGGAKGLPPAQVQRLTRLVENAVGIDSSRGDSVVIDSMAFAADDTLQDAEPGLLSRLPVDQLLSFAKLALIAGVGLVALRMIRPRPAADPQAMGETLLAAHGAEPPLLGDGDGAAQLALSGAALKDSISLSQVDGQIKAEALQRVGEAVLGSPGEATAVIRQWMNP